MTESSAGDDDGGQYFAYAPNTGAVFAVGQGKGQPPTEPTYVKLMPDYSAEMPLWGMPWKDLDLNPALIDRLRAWQRPQVPALDATMYLTVQTAAVESGWLELSFDYEIRLRVSPNREFGSKGGFCQVETWRRPGTRCAPGP